MLTKMIFNFSVALYFRRLRKIQRNSLPDLNDDQIWNVISSVLRQKFESTPKAKDSTK
jgi:hypothetical protein